MVPEHPCTFLINMPKMHGPGVLYLGHLSELCLLPKALKDEIMSSPGQISGFLPIAIKVRDPELGAPHNATYHMSRHPLKPTCVIT